MPTQPCIDPSTEPSSFGASTVVEETIDKVGVAETEKLRVGEAAKIAASEAPKLKSVIVHFYGGIITVGNEVGDNRFSMLIQSMLQYHNGNVDAVVSNFGIGDIGPDL